MRPALAFGRRWQLIKSRPMRAERTNAVAVLGGKYSRILRLGVFLAMASCAAGQCDVVCNGYCLRPLEASECPTQDEIDAIVNLWCSSDGLTVGDLCEGDEEQNEACGYDFSQTNNCGTNHDVWIFEAPAPTPPSMPPLPPHTPINAQPRTEGRCTVELTSKERCETAARAADVTSGYYPFPLQLPGPGCVYLTGHGGMYSWNPHSTSVDCSSSKQCICGGGTPPPPPPPPPPPRTVGAKQDPHFRLACGGRADFRGKHGTIYNFLSSQNVSVNMKVENATFNLEKLVVHGTFMTEIHAVLRTHRGRLFNISYFASELNEHNWGWHMINGSCALPYQSWTGRCYAGHGRAVDCPMKGQSVPFSLSIHEEQRCDNVRASVDYSTLTIEADEWLVKVIGMPVYDRIDGPRHRLDVTISRRVGEYEMAAPPHGLVGQSFDGEWHPGRVGSYPRQGKLDMYPPRKVVGEFTTQAMAEGAIDGVARDYEMASNFETAFKYSSFGALTKDPKRMGPFYFKNAGRAARDCDGNPVSAQATEMLQREL